MPKSVPPQSDVLVLGEHPSAYLAAVLVHSTAKTRGMHVTINDKTQVRSKVLLLAGRLPEAQQKRLGLPESWGAEVVHRYSYIKLAGSKWGDLGGRPVMPMSLNLKETLCWAWLLPGPK